MEVNKKTAYIISLKFAPGLKKEFTVIGENLRKFGLDVKYIISQKYCELEYSCDGMVYIPTRDGISGMIGDVVKFYSLKDITKIFSDKPPSFVCFYNPHALNPQLAYLIKRKFPDIILSLYLHDPYKPEKSPYGFKKGMYMKVVEIMQGWTVKYMDYVISPSEYSSDLFKKKYPNFRGKNFIAPLLVPDAKVNLEKERRRFFSIVGNAHNATGHDTFVELVNYVAKNDLDYEFYLISSSKIGTFLRNLNEKGKKILRIINKPVIKDSEINEVIRESWAVFRLDREVTQSGVVPVAYMNQTPVIARDIPGLTQHVWHGKTGYIVPFGCSPKDLIIAMDYVRNNFTELSRNARKSYEEIWADWNFDKYYGWLINLLETDKSKL